MNKKSTSVILSYLLIAVDLVVGILFVPFLSERRNSPRSSSLFLFERNDVAVYILVAVDLDYLGIGGIFLELVENCRRALGVGVPAGVECDIGGVSHLRSKVVEQ